MGSIALNSNTGHSMNHIEKQGVVYKKIVGKYEVFTGEQTLSCAIAAKLQKELSSDLIAVGDRVRYIETANGTGTIIELLPRQNKLSRQSSVPMPGVRAFEQVIVANVDQAIPVFAVANPAPRWNMLDRYLVTAEAHDLPALICITKIDLLPEINRSDRSEIEKIIADYRRIGYPVVQVSAVTGEGLEALQQALSGRTSVLLGKSGVGKTSLLNAIQPGLGLRVNEVSRGDGRGKHTTTHHEMFPLPSGGSIVDTPGVREFGLWDIDDYDLALFFPEMRPLLGKCKFGANCQHDNEPNCAVRKAVVHGEISPRRYQSYLRMKQED